MKHYNYKQQSHVVLSNKTEGKRYYELSENLY